MNGVIICGVDDSESAKGAARVARALGSELGLDVLFVRAIEREAADADVDAISERPLRMAHAVLDDVRHHKPRAQTVRQLRSGGERCLGIRGPVDTANDRFLHS
jgi:hypothetical protein